MRRSGQRLARSGRQRKERHRLTGAGDPGTFRSDRDDGSNQGPPAAGPCATPQRLSSIRASNFTAEAQTPSPLLVVWPRWVISDRSRLTSHPAAAAATSRLQLARAVDHAQVRPLHRRQRRSSQHYGQPATGVMTGAGDLAHATDVAPGPSWSHCMTAGCLPRMAYLDDGRRWRRRTDQHGRDRQASPGTATPGDLEGLTWGFPALSVLATSGAKRHAAGDTRRRPRQINCVGTLDSLNGSGAAPALGDIGGVLV